MPSALTDPLVGRAGASGRAVLLAIALSAIGALTSAPARADCTGGTTITCTSSGGTQTAPIGTGAQDGYTVNVQSGATIDVTATSFGTAIDLRDTNIVTNAGSIVAGDSSTGVYVNNGNTVTNSGSIAVGFNSTAISVCCDNTVINSGTISAGSSGFGIYGSDRNNVTNSGTIGVGAASYGIFMYGDGASSAVIRNNGTINALGGYGIGAVDNYIVNNTGTISVGNNGFGIQVGAGNAITNSGTINVGAGGIGVYLNGLSGAATSSNTFINSGSINANGGYSIAGDSENTITNNGYLKGQLFLFGVTSGNNTLTNNGYIVAGDAAGFTTASGTYVNGTLINGPAGTFAVRVSPTVNDGFVAGTIALDGKLSIVVTPGLYNATTVYSEATTGGAPVQVCGSCGAGLSGQFSSVTSTSPFFTASASYDYTGNGVTTFGAVNVTLTRLAMAAIPGMTANQRAVGNVLEPGYSTGLTGDLATFYANLLSAPSLSVLDQLSGAGTAAAQDGAFAAGGQFSGMMMQQVMGWLNGTPSGSTFTFGAPLGYASTAKNKFAGKPGHDAFAAMPAREQTEQGLWRAWTLGFGGARTVDGESGTADQKATTVGGGFGVDRQLSGDLLLGFAAGGSTSHFSASGVATSGRIDAGHIGLYGVQRLGAAYVAATVNYARGDTATDRTIAGVGSTEIAKGRFASDQLSGRVEIGRKYGFNGYSLTPFVALEPAVLWQRAYTENSTTLGGAPGMLGLSYGANTVTSLPLLIGAQADARYALGGQTLSPFARLSWLHAFKPERSITASFISIPGAAFTADGARPASDALRIEAGGTLSLSRRAALFATLNSEVSARSRSIAATAGVRTNW